MSHTLNRKQLRREFEASLSEPVSMETIRGEVITARKTVEGSYLANECSAAERTVIKVRELRTLATEAAQGFDRRRARELNRKASLIESRLWS